MTYSRKKKKDEYCFAIAIKKQHIGIEKKAALHY
jgi:hypothetical protein